MVATILFSGLFFLTFIWYYEYIGGFFAKIRRAYDLSSNSETSLYRSLKKVFQTDFSSILLRKGGFYESTIFKIFCQTKLLKKVTLVSPRDLFSISAITNDDKIGVGDVVLSKAPRHNPDYSLSIGTQRILALENSHPQVLRNGSD